MSQQPSQTWQSQPWNYQQQEELVQQQQEQLQQSSLNLSQLPADVLFFGDPSTSDGPPYIDDSNRAVHEQLVTGSIQQQNDTLSTRQNLLTHRQQRQQRWLSQYPYSRQREVQTPNKSFTPPTQSEHQLDRQNSVQDMLGVFPIEPSEYVQSQAYPPTGSTSISQLQTNIQQVSLQQSNFPGNGFPDKSSQMETDMRSSQSQ
ncbi:5053_t:CDS:2, partial [Paraglomus brasilianum]